MTLAVKSRAFQSPTNKIDKNVKIVEIDHSGAYLCGHKLSELLNLYYNGLKVLFEGRKRHLKNLPLKSDWKQWRLFCFVSSTSKLGLDYFTAFVFKQCFINDHCHFNENNVNYEKKIGHSNEIGHLNVEPLDRTALDRTALERLGFEGTANESHHKPDSSITSISLEICSSAHHKSAQFCRSLQ